MPDGPMSKEHAHIQKLKCYVLPLTPFRMENSILPAGPLGRPVFQGGVQSAISKTAIVFRSQTLFGSVISNFPSLQGHPKTWQGEVIFARDDNK